MFCCVFLVTHKRSYYNLHGKRFNIIIVAPKHILCQLGLLCSMLCMHFVDLILYCVLRAHVRCKHLTNTLLHYLTYLARVLCIILTKNKSLGFAIHALAELVGSVAVHGMWSYCLYSDSFIEKMSAMNSKHSCQTLTPSLPQPVKFSGWKVHTYTRLQTEYFPVLCTSHSRYWAFWQRSCQGFTYSEKENERVN